MKARIKKLSMNIKNYPTWNELKQFKYFFNYQDFTISDLIIRNLLNSNINQLVVDSKPLIIDCTH